MLPELPGFALEVAPGSVTFPGGSRSGTVSATLVHADKVPMVPNFGQQPNFIVTIQPAGAVFDPPARITLPNTDGLVPGEVTELYSFDHDLGQFVSIGPGSVSNDGSVVASDPGVGILKAGWHCGGNPASTGTPHNCPQCKVCNGSGCVPGCSTSALVTAQGSTGDAAQSLGCSCDDRNPCSVDDACNNGTCRGRQIRLDSVTVLANGQATPLEIELDSSGPATVNFEAQVSPQDHGCSSITYNWQFGDGGFGSGQTTSHAYFQDGIYFPKMTARCVQCQRVKRDGGTGVEVYEVQMLLEQEGETEISTDGKFTEDTAIRVTAVKSTTGAQLHDFQGTVTIEEVSQIPVYSQNDGELPSSAEISFSGTTTILARSQAEMNNGNRPDDALITITSHEVYGIDPLAVPQWVDNQQLDPKSLGPVLDWLEARVLDIFESFGDLGAVSSALATVSAYEQVRLGYPGELPISHTQDHTMRLDPYSETELRVPGQVLPSACTSSTGDGLTLTVVHEARHGYQDLLSTIDFGAPDDIPGAPDNDDDQDWMLDIVPASACPCQTLLDTTDVRRVCNQEGNFPLNIPMSGELFPERPAEIIWALEEDAIQFSTQHVP